MTSNEAKIILGAAVIDDVLGLLVLATVGGIIAAAEGGIQSRSRVNRSRDRTLVGVFTHRRDRGAQDHAGSTPEW